MPSPADCRYSDSHEWFRHEGDTVTMGITPHAASELTDITYVELRPTGTAIDAGDADRVTALLTPMPEGMSKSMMKKLVKQAQIAAKRRNLEHETTFRTNPVGPAAADVEMAGKPSAPPLVNGQ